MSWQPSDDPVLGDPKAATRSNSSSCRAPAISATGSRCGARCRMASGRWSDRSSSSIISARCSSCPARAWTCARIRISGFATVTYLFDGSIMHRDSEGNIQEIQPGAMNLMTAGRGIAHSERTPDVQRRDGQKMLGLQSWIALPAARRKSRRRSSTTPRTACRR